MTERLGQWKTTVQWIMVTSSALLSLILIATPLSFYTLLTPLPKIHEDIGQYVSGWSSGWGVQEASHFLQKENPDYPKIIFIRNDSGNPEDGIYVYLSKIKNINIVPISYMNQTIDLTKNIPNISYYFVSRGTQMAKLETRVNERIRYTKPLDDEFIGVYKIVPQ